MSEWLGSLAGSLGSSTSGMEGITATLMTGVAAVAGLATLKATVSTIQGHTKRKAADRKRDRKREECRNSIQDLQDRLDRDPMQKEEVERITGLCLTDLITQLKSGQITPPQALKAYQTKALQTHATTNCLIEVVREAESWAEQVEKGPRDGLLYGVPISLKEDVALKGYDSTLGCVDMIDKPAEDDAAIVKVLKRHGAVPFVRSNVPQLCMSFEPGNPIFGTVLNPCNLAHGPGGSSSGEAALAAAGASPLGIGSDLAGSIRVPAHFTGVCGFKPTSQRMSNVGCLAGYSCYEQNEISPVFGPLTPEVDGVVLALKALWDGGSPSLTDLDPTKVPMPFNEQVYSSSKKLRIGYYTEDGVFPVFPGCARAVEQAKEQLEKLGHEVVQWTIPDMGRARDLLFAVAQADGGEFMRQLLKYDQTDPNISHLFQEVRFPWLRKCVASLIRPLMPQYADQLANTDLLQLDLASFFFLVSELREYIVDVMRQWQEAGLDALLCPPFALPSPPLGNALICLVSGAYTMTYNSLNLPAGVVRFTEVTSQDIDNLKDYPEDGRFYVLAKEVMAQTLGMPMGVMVVGPRYQDEVCLRLMKELEDARRNLQKLNETT